jgi:hypothetical protein
MAEADPAEFCRINDPGHCLARDIEHFPEAGVHQERLFVFDQELVEFN